MTLVQLALYFSLLSVISVGGLPAVMGEVQRIVVERHAWVTAAEFVQLYAVGQASPGPNMLIVSLIGWKVSGVPGAFVALIAMCGPAAAIGSTQRSETRPMPTAIRQPSATARPAGFERSGRASLMAVPMKRPAPAAPTPMTTARSVALEAYCM